MNHYTYIDRIQQKPALKGIDAVVNTGLGHLTNLIPRQTLFLYRAAKVQKICQEIENDNDTTLKNKMATAASIAARGQLSGKDLLNATAYVCEASRRTMGMLPYKVQIAAALSLQAGYIAEMATGEGKSLTAAVAGVLIGWRRKGCHVMTSNHYLACRDAETFKPLFDYCDVTIGSISEKSENDDRRKAYACDLTYCTNKDVAADFLRDQLALGSKQNSARLLLKNMCTQQGTNDLILRGLENAIVDEADSVMIDDGVTPLLISTESDKREDSEIFKVADKMARGFSKNHFIAIGTHEIELTDSGKDKLEKLCQGRIGVWQMPRRREEIFLQALKAHHLFEKDREYIIEDGKVVIVDKATGRTMPDRFWRNGMHQAVEAKEGLDISPSKDTCARISFQKFFRFYKSICGMTGTAREASSEFWELYSLPLVRIPTHRPCIRQNNGALIFFNQKKKWATVAQEIKRMSLSGRPILVGTSSIHDSEQLSQILEGMQIKHHILNARNHAEESVIISQAGQVGAITVTTSMAGRGTDIKLSDRAKVLGGLYVMSTQLYHSKRIDRQLYGRCSRQGDPGSYITFIALDDEIFMEAFPLIRTCLKALCFLPSTLLMPLINAVQKKAVKARRKQRAAVMKSDDWLEDALGFAGEDFT
jgi:preprotein translocase subunit SecA